jgi:signal transduction histidine kinase
LLFAVAVSALTWLVFTVLHIRDYQATADMESVNDILDTSVTVLAVVVGGLVLLRWRLVGERRDIAFGVGLILLGGVGVGFDELVVPRLPVDVRDDALVGSVASFGYATGTALLALPVLPLSRRLRARVRGIALGPGIAVVGIGSTALLAFLVAWPEASDALAGRRDAALASSAQSAAQVVFAVVFLFLAGRFWLCADPDDRPLYAWLALLVFGLGQARFALALTYPAGTLWLAASRILRFEGMLFALMGVNRDLREHLSRQASALRLTEARVRSIEVQREAERRAQEERQHDLRSALFAIGGVADLLRRGQDELDAGTIDALTDALGTEVARVQELVAEREREDLKPFSLRDLLAPLVVMEQSNGRDVTLAVSEHLTARGRPTETAQVVRNLLDNAARYAPHCPVAIRAEARDDWVVVVVEDTGPGVPPSERRTIFERSRRGSTSADTEGSGLGLYVASRLMREQGGDLWVGDRPGGGAAFLLSLPAGR